MLEALVKRAPLAPVGEAEAACERRRGPLGGAALAENAGQVLAERDRERDGRGGVWGVTEQKTTLRRSLWRTDRPRVARSSSFVARVSIGGDEWRRAW